MFVDFQKAFDTVDHTILTQKINYYGVRGKANNCFSSYLKNRKKFVTFNGFNSELKDINCGVPQGSILGPLLFLIYINDLHYSIKFSSFHHCKVHHFADDTNQINFNSFIKVINKQVKKDLKTLSNWLNANKICLNVSKTELFLFRSAKKQLDFGLKLRLNGKRLYPTNSVKYLGVKIDEHWTWKSQIDGISTKLNKSNAILSKVRHFVDQKTLKAIYHAIFESHLYSSSLVWAQNFNSTKRLFILQKKALRLMFFLRREAHTNPLFKDFNILKFHDKIALENCIFIQKFFKQQLPQPFDNWFGLSSNFVTHNTRWSNLGCLNVPSHRTKLYGRNCVCISAIFT